MMKKNISDYWNKGKKGHSNYDFVDVAVNDDNLLFIVCIMGLKPSPLGETFR